MKTPNFRYAPDVWTLELETSSGRGVARKIFGVVGQPRMLEGEGAKTNFHFQGIITGQ